MAVHSDKCLVSSRGRKGSNSSGSSGLDDAAMSFTTRSIFTVTTGKRHAQALAEGQAMAPDEAIEYALAQERVAHRVTERQGPAA